MAEGGKKMKKKLLSIFMGLCLLVGGGTAVSAADVRGTMRDITPAAIAKEMTAGWNLGNSLDAYGTYSLNNETYWGNPKTTKAMIDAVKNEGFNTIRIPVSWGEHVGSAPNYTIDTAWMNRVQEVVDYAMADGMYVLLDTHHETSWLKPQSATLDASQKQLVAIWTQIAERFKAYGDHLLFEGMNEPRIVGSSNEWSGGDADGRAAVNVLNQAFIDAVRKTGGNNAKRCLIICPYGNNGDPNGLSGFKIPSDKNIMVAIHAYTPYGFTFRPEGNPSWARTTWDGSGKSDIEYLMNNLNTSLISKGVTVIITEFGAVHKNNESEVVKWVKDYVSLATQYGIKCVWWDNNYHKNDGESFGLLDRNSCSWTRKSVADAVIKYAGSAVPGGGTETPTTPETPQAGDMIKVQIVSDWTSGATANITVTNLTGKALNGWTCTFTLDRPITSLWSATLVSQVGNTYTIANPDWQPHLAAGESYTFGCNLGSGPAQVTVTGQTLK